QRLKDRERGRDRDKERERDRDWERNREREKERDRDRDRDRLRDRDKRDRTRDNRDRFHDRKDTNRSDVSSSYTSEKLINSSSERTNHGTPSREKMKADNKRMRVGDWVEYLSSSQKYYYYNRKTGVSQWEKPSEWIEYEKECQRKEEKATHSRVEKNSAKTQQASTSVDSEEPKRNVDNESNINNSNSLGSVKPQNEQIIQQMAMNSRDPRRMNAVYNSYSVERKKSTEHKDAECTNVVNDTSPSLIKTERRNSVNSGFKESNNVNEKANPTSTLSSSRGPGNSQPLGSNQDIISPSQITVSNLPKLISQLAHTHGLPDLSGLSPQDALKTITQALQLTKQVKQRSTNQPTMNFQKQTNVNSPLVSTPLQNQTVHGIRHELDLLINRTNWGQSPSSDVSVNSSTRSPTSSITSITPGISSSMRPSLFTLTPSLANYYREDLILHVVGWQADHSEKQAQRYAVEAHNTGSLDATRVSAELKMARSLVRLTEIQATLQEQRILFLRQQIKDVEEWKSQNASHFTQ
ncbi:WW domain-containing adapter protein with coiled-coil-like protein, partial [Dinothrombium tinctorium]